MAPLTSELSILLKDGLRGARYVFRKGTRIGREGSTISPAVPKLARLADSVFTATEKAAAALLSSEGDDLATAEAFAESFSAMLSTPSLSSGRSHADATRRRKRLHLGP
jgi:hypothetical protein